MPPKENKKYTLCFYRDDGTVGDVLDAPYMQIDFDTEEELFNYPWLVNLSDSVEVSYTFDMKRKPSVELFFPKKHRHNASVARKRRRYHGRTKNVCQNNNRQ